MSRCKFCRKPIKWIEVPVETDLGFTLKAKPFDKRKRASEPYRPHVCAALESLEPPPPRKPIDPWWNRD